MPYVKLSARGAQRDGVKRVRVNMAGGKEIGEGRKYY